MQTALPQVSRSLGRGVQAQLCLYFTPHRPGARPLQVSCCEPKLSRRAPRPFSLALFCWGRKLWASAVAHKLAGSLCSCTQGPCHSGKGEKQLRQTSAFSRCYNPRPVQRCLKILALSLAPEVICLRSNRSVLSNSVSAGFLTFQCLDIGHVWSWN